MLYRHWGKRIIDRTAAACGLVLLAPLMLVLSWLIRRFLGGPVLFRQPRIGKDGQVFEIFKFRSMLETRDQNGQFLPDAERLTSFGRLLRSSSLDELPALLNVLRGEMSLVGPRPLLIQYRERYNAVQWRRHEVYPGITGWAQINGRNAISWEQKFDFDVWYVDHLCFWLDLRILALTAYKVVQRADINRPGQATVEEFMGTSATTR